MVASSRFISSESEIVIVDVNEVGPSASVNEIVAPSMAAKTGVALKGTISISRDISPLGSSKSKT